MFNATPNLFKRVLVTAEVEFQGQKIQVRQMIDAAVWDRYPDIEGEVKRGLRRALADEILQVIDPKFTITR